MDKKRLYWFVGVLVLTAVAWVMVAPDYVGLCPYYGEDGFYSCIDKYIHIGEPASLLMSALSVSFLLVLFTEAQVFRAWKKFTLITIPIIIVLVTATPEYGGTFIDLDREIVTWGFGIAFPVVSILVVAYKSWKLKKAKLI